jgi:hypothetical protein
VLRSKNGESTNGVPGQCSTGRTSSAKLPAVIIGRRTLLHPSPGQLLMIASGAFASSRRATIPIALRSLTMSRSGAPPSRDSDRKQQP